MNANEKQARATTHSVWSGKRYTRPQTVESLSAESRSVLQRNSATARTMANMDAWIKSYAAANGLKSES